MADDNKLWFEMGVRDNVTNSLGKILELTKTLSGEMNKVVISAEMLGKIGKVKFDNGQAVRNALSFQNMLITIDNMMTKISGRRVTATVAVDKLDQAAENLKQFREQLLRLQDISGDAWNGDLLKTQQASMRNVLNVVNQLLREQANEQRNASDATRQNVQANKDLVSAYDKVISAGKNTNRMLDQMKVQMASTFSLYATEHLLKSIIQIGGEFEVQHIALKSILGDIEQANTMFNEIKQLAVVSPFNFSQLISYSKQIAAFNIPYEEMYDTTKRLADMSAGLGVDMSRLILAYGQVRSAAVLRGQELRQFTEAGIPLVQALADEFTRLNGRAVTTGEVFELISRRAVPFEMVKKILWDMTDEGGRFFNMQFTLADTLAGKWSNLVDAWQIMLSGFAKGESLGGKVLKNFVQLTTYLIEALDKIGPILGGLGMARVSRYGENLLASFTGKDVSDMIAKTQRLYVAEQRRKVVNHEITAEEYKQNVALGRNRNYVYQQLAIEGRLKDYQIAKAIQQGRINVSKQRENALIREGRIQEAAQLRMWRMKLANASAFNLRLKAVGVTLKSLMGPFGWISLAIEGLVMLTTEWLLNSERSSDKMNEAVSNFANSARDRGREIKESLAGLNNSNPSTDEDYRNAISSMKEQLKQYDANYDSIMREADGLATLKEKYELLREELVYVGESYQLAGESKADFEDLYKDTDKLNEAAKSWATTNDKLNRSLNILAAEGSQNVENAIDTLAKKMPKLQELLFDDDGNKRKTNDILRDFADRITNDDIQLLRNAIRGHSAGGHAVWDEYVSIFESMDKADRAKFDEYLRNTQKRTLQYNDKISSRVEDVVNETYVRVAAELGEKVEALKKRVEKSGNDLDQKTKTLLRNYFSQQMSAITDGNQSLMRWIDSQRWTLYFHYDIVTDYNDKNGGLQGIAATSWANLNPDNIPMKNPGQRKGFSEKDMKDAFGASGNDVNNAKKVLSQRLKQQEDLIYDLETAKGATDDQVNEAKSVFRAMERDWNSMFTDNWRNLNSRGNRQSGGGSKKDNQLDRIKNQVELYKKFYSELESYTDMYGKRGAIRKLKSDGEFGAVFGWDNVSDVSDYRKTVNELTATLKNNSDARDKFLNSTKADIQARARKEETEELKTYVSELKRMMSVMSESYDTYRKWVDLTGDTSLAASIAGVTQNTNYAEWLADSMKDALDKTNLALTPEDVFGLSESEISKFGKDSLIFSIWDEWQKNQKKVKKDNVDLFESAIKNAKDFQDEIDDLNRELQKTLDSIDKMPGISDTKKTKLRQSATENTQEKIDSILYEQFKKDSDWNKIFENLDNVTYETITTLIEKMKEFGTQATIDVKNTKEWVDAWNKLNDAAVERNPFGMLFSTIKTSGEIKSLLKKNKDQNSFVLSAEQAARYGLKVNRKDTYSRRELSDAAMGLDKKSGGVWTGLAKKFKVLQDALQPVIDLFDELGNTTLSDIFKAGNNALTSAANTAGAFSKLGEMAKDGGMAGLSSALSSAGPYAAAAAAAIQIASTAISMFGADYSDYNRMKEQYENLIDVWDDLIDRKREYLSENWGTEAKNAGREILGLMQSEMEQTRIIAEKRLKAGKSAGSHTLEYRMWQGSYKYNGQNWKDVAKGISQQLGGVKFTEMGDLLNMTSEQLLWIKTNYAGLWSTMDNDFKGYLDELIKYSDTEKEILDDLQEKLTGMDFEDVVSDYASCLSDMENGNKELGKNLRDNLKDAILNAMVANVYGDRIKELISMTNELGSNGERVFDANGRIMSEYTKEEMDLIEAFSDKLDEDMEASRNKLRDLYGWKSDGDSSSQNAIVKAITEQDTSLWASYWNAMRLDISVIRATEGLYLPVMSDDIKEVSVIAKSQLEHMGQIAENTKRNAEAADKIFNLLHGLAPDGTGWKIK